MISFFVYVCKGLIVKVNPRWIGMEEGMADSLREEEEAEVDSGVEAEIWGREGE